MTNNEAIKYLNDLRDSINGAFDYNCRNQCTALDIAIKALKQEPCEDCVSRQTLDEIKELMTDINGDTVYAVRMSDLRQLPSVTPQPKMGRWVLSGGYWRCSECKEKALLKLDKSEGGCKEYMPIKSKYCPNCGSKMEGKE